MLSIVPIQLRSRAAETRRMKHIILDVEDVPPPTCLMDRRVNLDRREIWRGGRRDTDWTNRPRDGWERLDPATPPRWRAVLSTLHLLA